MSFVSSASQNIAESEVEPQEYTEAEYIYPIAQLDDDCLLIMCQKSYDDLELWTWNRRDKKAFRELTSIFLPSHVRLLPSKTAFSFIDHGRIRIKSFQKRAPRVINLPESIYAISSLKWINDDQFYFVGKESDNFSVFLCDVSDRNVTLFYMHDKDKLDYLYPCKIDDILFCITKDDSSCYAFCKMAWDMQPYYAATALYQKSHKKILIDSPDYPLCFLHMENKHYGFVLKYDHTLKDPDFFYLTCCALTDQMNIDQINNDTWSLQELFDFKLPLRLLTGTDKTRMYESIDPFLPRYDHEWIYFVTYDDLAEKCCVRRYHRQLRHIEDIEKNTRSFTSFYHVFAPLIVDDCVYFGFSCNNTRSILSSPHTNSMTGMITCHLPEITQ